MTNLARKSKSADASKAKAALLPAVRVDTRVRADAERAIEGNESLSSFIEGAVVNETARRMARRAFVERGLAASAHARKTGIYHSTDAVLRELEETVTRAEAKEGSR